MLKFNKNTSQMGLKVALGMALVSLSAPGQAWEEFDSQVGMGYKFGFVKPSSHWSPVFKSGTPGGILWGETKLLDWLSIELGYDWSTRESKSHSVPAGDHFLGVTNQSGKNLKLTGQVRFKSFYTALNAHASMNQWIPTEHPFNLLFSLGLGSQRPHFTTQVDQPYAPMEKQITFSSRTRVIPRIGLGAQLYFSENWGIQTMLRYELNSKIRVHAEGAPAQSAYEKIFKNNCSLGLGVVWRL